MKWTEEQVSKVLSRISSSIPDNLKRNIVAEIPRTPTMEFVMKKALELPEISEEKKKNIRHLLATGDFSKMKLRENLKITRMVDNYVGRKINEAIKKGELPPRHLIKTLPWYKKLISQKN